MTLSIGEATAVTTLLRWLGVTEDRTGTGTPNPQEAAAALEKLAAGAGRALQMTIPVDGIRKAFLGDHLIEIREDGWTIQHPLGCRPALFACLVNRAAERDLTARPFVADGTYACDLDDDGRFRIRTSEPDEDVLWMSVRRRDLDHHRLTADRLHTRCGRPVGVNAYGTKRGVLVDAQAVSDLKSKRCPRCWPPPPRVVDVVPPLLSAEAGD